MSIWNYTTGSLVQNKTEKMPEILLTTHSWEDDSGPLFENSCDWQICFINCADWLIRKLKQTSLYCLDSVTVILGDTPF